MKISVQGATSQQDQSVELVIRGVVPYAERKLVDYNKEGKELADYLLKNLSGGVFDAMMFTIMDEIFKTKGQPCMAAIHELRNDYERKIS